MWRGTWIGAAALLIVLPASAAWAQEAEPESPAQAVEEEEGDAGQGAAAAGEQAPGAADRAAEQEMAQPGAEPEPEVAQPGAEPEAPQVAQPGAEPEPEAQPGAAPAPEQPQAAQPGAAPTQEGPQVAQPLRRRITGPGAPPTDGAWRQLISPELDVAQRSELAAERLTAAERALAEGNAEVARSALQSATQSLEAILTDGPGAALASELGAAAAQLRLPEASEVQVDELAGRVQALSPVLPGEVLSLTRDAQRQVQRGDLDGASHSLLGARNWIIADLGLAPAEDAFARSRSALTEVEAGNLELARDLVQGMPASIAKLRTAAPLVPVRLRLRAAANQASERNWAGAEVLLNEASAELRSLRDEASPALTRRIDSLQVQVGALQERLTTGREPSPARIRRVAEAAGGVPAG